MRENGKNFRQFHAELYPRIFANFDAIGEGMKYRRPIQIKYYL